jgi:hypothetical protein
MMKLVTVLLCISLLLTLLAGCRRQTPNTTTADPSTTTVPLPTPVVTTPGTSDTKSAELLAAIWNRYAQEERFASYGGTVEHSISDAPGDLDLGNIDELTGKYLIPSDRVEQLEDAASLVHMMNSNIFTAAVVELSDVAQLGAFAESWRDAIRQNRWICGQPDRMVMAVPEQGRVLMAFGSSDAMDVFETHMKEAYPSIRILYQEAVVG